MHISLIKNKFIKWNVNKILINKTIKFNDYGMCKWRKATEKKEENRRFS